MALSQFRVMAAYWRRFFRIDEAPDFRLFQEFQSASSILITPDY